MASIKAAAGYNSDRSNDKRWREVKWKMVAALSLLRGLQLRPTLTQRRSSGCSARSDVGFGPRHSLHPGVQPHSAILSHSQSVASHDHSAIVKSAMFRTASTPPDTYRNLGKDCSSRSWAAIMCRQIRMIIFKKSRHNQRFSDMSSITLIISMIYRVCNFLCTSQASRGTPQCAGIRG